MTEEVENLNRKSEKIARNEQKLEFLSLSCPRASEYVLRTKKINEKKVSCQRGNAEILEEFFKILESSEIEELRFHIVDIGQEDLKVFKKKLQKDCIYQVDSIIFNQSADPQLIIEFALKCQTLKYLLAKGYNQKYPCNQADYLIRVYTTGFYQDCSCSQPCQCNDIMIPPMAEIVKSQIPLMCKPIEWTYKHRVHLLTKKIPERLLNAGFMHNSEFFFADPYIFAKPRRATTLETSGVENSATMMVNASKAGVFCKVQCQPSAVETVCFDSLRLLCLDRRVNRKNVDRLKVEKTLQMRSLLLHSDEERDLFPNQKTLMDMPLVVIDKIMDNLTFFERLPFRRSCRQLYTFPGSQKHVVESCKIDVNSVVVTIDGKRLKRRGIDERKELLDMISRNYNVEELCLDTDCRDLRENRRLMNELVKIEPIQVEILRVYIDRNTYGASMKFITEKCKGALKYIQLNCQEVEIDFKGGAHVEKILSAREVRIYGLSYRNATEGLEAFVEKAIVSGDGYRLDMDYFEYPDERVSLEKFQETYPERIISTSSSPDLSIVRIRTDDPTKHILLVIDTFFWEIRGKVVSADYVEEN